MIFLYEKFGGHHLIRKQKEKNLKKLKEREKKSKLELKKKCQLDWSRNFSPQVLRWYQWWYFVWISLNTQRNYSKFIFLFFVLFSYHYLSFFSLQYACCETIFYFCFRKHQFICCEFTLCFFLFMTRLAFKFLVILLHWAVTSLMFDWLTHLVSCVSSWSMRWFYKKIPSFGSTKALSKSTWYTHVPLMGFFG